MVEFILIGTIDEKDIASADRKTKRLQIIADEVLDEYKLILAEEE